MKRKLYLAAASALATFSLAGSAAAHVTVASGPGFADTTQEITFAVGHGCSGVDTYSVRIEIPAEVVSVRGEGSDFGPAAVETNAAALVTAVSWQKPLASLLAADTSFYKLTLRLKVPNQPFTKLYFPTHQVCRTSEGAETTVDWIGTDPDATGVEPAPALTILPKRYSGWNKFTVAAPVANLADYFSDAAIVWRGDSAYSSSPFTAELISQTPDVSVLSELDEGDEIWVKY